jgi:hypothetical protein
MKKTLLLPALLPAALSFAQTPEISAWIVNSTIETGYGGIETNVQQVDYSTANVYVACTCIPGYDIGPWTGNPNTPANQNFVFKITRNPVENTGTKTATALGHIGVWTNGVSVFNALDAFSYNNQNVWHQDAIPNEGASFDACLGHPAPNGEYHNHLNPTCLYDDDNSTIHSPIIGYAFDGFPIYGAYGYANADGTGGIARMTSSYQLRSITDRTTLPDGSTASSAGPVVSSTYPLGKYIEDYAYVAGLGTLDQYNGRFCVTPEYPSGIYAYFVTIDASGNGVYPYVIGPKYYGTVQAGNTGPGSGHNTISETVTNYATASVVTIEELQLDVYPNPVTDKLYIADAASYDIAQYAVISAEGMVLLTGTNAGNGIDVSTIARGTYFLVVEIAGVSYPLTFVK